MFTSAGASAAKPLSIAQIAAIEERWDSPADPAAANPALAQAQLDIRALLRELRRLRQAHAELLYAPVPPVQRR